MSIAEVKTFIQNMHGKTVLCEINKGRNKIVKIPAKINQIYSSMFTIEPQEIIELEKKSFSYSDVMCGVIKFL